MKLAVIVVALVAAVTANSIYDDVEWVDYRLVTDLRSTTPSDTVCVKEGFICKDCDNLIYCNNINGVWDEQFVEDCTISQNTCNVNKCSSTPSSECDNRDFSCTSLEGMYPDPTSCKKFYYCVPSKNGKKLDLVKSGCGEKYSYNPKSTYCDKPLANDTCLSYPVPICETLAQSDALKENPSIYYVCLPYDPQGHDTTLYPFLKLCENGKTYDPKITDCK